MKPKTTEGASSESIKPQSKRCVLSRSVRYASSGEFTTDLAKVNRVTIATSLVPKIEAWKLSGNS
jgi:hypothetical protein